MRLQSPRWRLKERRQKEAAREGKVLGFVQGSSPEAQSEAPVGQAMARSDAEINLALQTVREKTEAEARREVAQADRSAATNERPFEGGGDDHAYRTGAEAAAAARAERAVHQNPSRPIPADANQSPEIERQRQEQQQVLSAKQTNRRAETRRFPLAQIGNRKFAIENAPSSGEFNPLYLDHNSGFGLCAMNRTTGDYCR